MKEKGVQLRKVQFVIKDEQYQFLRVYAFTHRRDMSDVVRELIFNLIKKEEKK